MWYSRKKECICTILQSTVSILKKSSLDWAFMKVIIQKLIIFYENANDGTISQHYWKEYKHHLYDSKHTILILNTFLWENGWRRHFHFNQSKYQSGIIRIIESIPFVQSFNKNLLYVTVGWGKTEGVLYIRLRWNLSLI